MKKLSLKGKEKTTDIVIGESLRNIDKYRHGRNAVIVTDRNVGSLYKKAFSKLPVIEIGVSEKIKTLDTVQYIYEKLFELEADRSFLIIAIGGGIVLDIAGFAASTYMRGLDVIYVPTTLLAMTDASIGGKNGVNLLKYKNIVGVFNQPEAVIIDTDFLKTLPKRELSCGFAEVIKHGASLDESLFSYIEDNASWAVSLEKETIKKIIYQSLSAKIEIVERDEFEKGERKKLNFGHTIGHAIEKLTDAYTHGEAVSIGMVAEAGLSVKKGMLKRSDHIRLKNLLKSLDLPVENEIEISEIIQTVRGDKKRAGAKVGIVFLNGIGDSIVNDIDFEELEEMLK